jgi:hypothetical protein
MRGILPANEVLNLSTIKYELGERATGARLLFHPFNDISLQEVSQVHIQVVDAIVCSVRDRRRRTSLRLRGKASGYKRQTTSMIRASV